VVADPNGEVLVHLGAGNFLHRYKTYITHVQQWRQQFDKLESVDLRYDGQIIVNPDLEGIRRPPTLTAAAAKAAMAAGVKPAAIVNYEKYVTHPVPPGPAKKSAKTVAKAPAKAVAHRAAARPRGKHAATATTRQNARSHPTATAVIPASAKKSIPDTAKTSKPAPTVALPPAQSKTAPSFGPPPAQPSKPAPSAALPPSATSSQKKPSPGIPKEASQNPR
jgi:hypothetical protein